MKRRGGIVVVGGINIDIQGRSGGPFRSGDSNPGIVARSPGGVGRNIAENLARLGESVELITVLGDDPFSAELESSCAAKGIGLSGLLRLPETPASSYLCLIDSDGALVGAVAAMEGIARLGPEDLAQRCELLDAARLIIVDANLSRPSIAWLAARYGPDGLVERQCAEAEEGPVLALDPVSVAKAGRAAPFLGAFAFAKPNLAEAAVLAGDPSCAAGGSSFETGGPSCAAGGPSLSAGGPSLSADGPSLSAGGPSLSAGGPSCKAGGASLSAGGPSLSADGPSCKAGGPSFETGGPSLSAGSPSLSAGGPSCKAGGPSLSAGGPSFEAGGPSCKAGGPSLSADGASLSAGGPSCAAGGPSYEAGGLSLSAGGPSCKAGGPSFETGGPSLSAGGPSFEAGGPSFEAGGPSFEAGGPSFEAGGPSFEAGGPSLSAGGASLSAGGPSFEAGSPSLSAGGPSCKAGGPSLSTGGPSCKAGGPSLSAGGPSLSAGGPSCAAGGPSLSAGGPEARSRVSEARVLGAALRAKGLGEAFISLGAGGIYAEGPGAKPGETERYIAWPPSQTMARFPPKNVSGAGDAACAALAMGWMQGMGLAERACLAIAAALLAAASESTVNPIMKRELLRELAKGVPYEPLS